MQDIWRLTRPCPQSVLSTVRSHLLSIPVWTRDEHSKVPSTQRSRINVPRPHTSPSRYPTPQHMHGSDARSPSPPESMHCERSGTSREAALRLLIACIRSSLWHISYRQPAAADKVAMVTVPCHLRPHEFMLSSVLESGSGLSCGHQNED